MSNTEALRAAAQQALVALVHHTEQTRPIQRTADAIAALRAALAQPAASGEPVWQRNELSPDLAGVSFATAQPAPAPTPATAGKLGMSMVCPYCEQGFTAIQEPQPAPARVPLTDAQRDAMWHAACQEGRYRTGFYEWYAQGLDDAERAHGITAVGPNPTSSAARLRVRCNARLGLVATTTKGTR